MRLKILGPPGTGKTTRVLEYVDHYYNDGTNKQIAVCTFSVGAKDEVIKRLKAKDAYDKKRIDVQTIHAHAFNHMHFKKSYMINNLSSFAASIGEKSKMKDDRVLFAKTPLEKAIAWHQFNRSMMIDTGAYLPAGLSYEAAESYVKQYGCYKTAHDLIDYHDVLQRYLDDGQPLNFDVVIVDEAQDLSVIQWEVFKKMFGNVPVQIMAGDDDQTIYSFAGVKPELFINWEADKVEVLHKSHRYGREIYEYSKHCLLYINNRLEKDYEPSEKPSKVTFTHNVNPVTDILPYRSCAILHRNSYVAAPLRDMLTNLYIPYTGKGSPFNYRGPINVINLWERWRSGEELVCGKIERIKEYLRKDLFIDGCEDKTYNAKGPACPYPDLPWHEALTLQHANLYKAVCFRYGYEVLIAPPKITVTTIHQAKGGEWDKVILLTDVSGSTYRQFKYGTQEDRDAEARVWYTATTRPKEALQVILPKTNKFYPLKGVL